MKIAFEKRKRIANIFAKVAEYTVAILVLGSIVGKEINKIVIFVGLIMFIVFFLISVVAEPVKEEEEKWNQSSS